MRIVSGFGPLGTAAAGVSGSLPGVLGDVLPLGNSSPFCQSLFRFIDVRGGPTRDRTRLCTVNVHQGESQRALSLVTDRRRKARGGEPEQNQ